MPLGGGVISQGGQPPVDSLWVQGGCLLGGGWGGVDDFKGDKFLVSSHHNSGFSIYLSKITIK